MRLDKILPIIWLTVVLIAGAVPAALADTIAYWKFEPNAMDLDSSGMENPLIISGGTSSVDKAASAPGSGSIQLGGAATLQTSAPLDLTAPQGVTFEWFMKIAEPHSSLGMVWELSGNFNGTPGSAVVYINESAPDQIVFGNFTGRGYSIISGKYPKDGQWHHYAVTIDTARYDNQRQKIYIDGVDIAATGGVLGGSTPEPLGIHTLFIGARNASAFLLNAAIDEFRISGVLLDPDQFLAPVSYPDAVLSFSREPEDVTANENQDLNGGETVVLDAHVIVQNAPRSAIRYQWQRKIGNGEWTNIEGATGSTYNPTALSRTDSGNRYRLNVRVIGSTVSINSREAVVTIIPDNTAPEVLSAAYIANSIGICFSEALNPESAGSLANYSATGATISAVEVQPDGRSVKLLLEGAPLANATLRVSAIADLAGNSMTARDVAFVRNSMEMVDIAPELAPVFQPGSVFSCGEGEILAIAGGADVWGNADSFQFIYEEKTGDFDIRTQVSSVQAASFYARGGLMARESLTAESRHVHVPIYPTRNVFGMFKREETGSVTDQVGSFIDFGSNAAFPNVWIRLKREENTFRSFWSNDGTNWSLIGAYTPNEPYPDQLFVGLGTTAQQDATGVSATVQYKNYSEVEVGTAIITITSHPASVTLPEGASARFTVVADISGVPASEVSYQWQWNGQNIAGATGASYTTPVLTPAETGGKYRVILKAGTTTVTSNEATLTVTPNPALVKRTIVEVQVVNPANGTLNNRGDQGNAIDGDILTLSYMTPSGTASPQIIAFNLGDEPLLVNRIRAAKVGNTDGIGGNDNMDLEILYTTGTGPLETRTWSRVTGLVNGYYGNEPIQAVTVSPNGTVDNDSHDFPSHGWYALTFDSARATAIGIRVARDAAEPFQFVHYPLHELEIWNDRDFSNTTLSIAQQPQSITVDEFGSATFTVAATGEGIPASALAYQWRRNNVDIPGATGTSYTATDLARTEQGARYSVVVSLGATSVTSQDAVVTITPDQTSPQVISASSFDGNVLHVCFNEALRADSLANLANFSLGGNGQVQGATLLPDGKTVALAVSGLSAGAFTLTVQGVQDRAGNSSPSATVNGQVEGFTSMDIAPELAPVFFPGQVVSCMVGDYDILAGGADIFGTQDSFHFLARQVTGDFDVRVQIPELLVNSFYARSGIMAREDLTPESRNLHVVVYPTREVFLTTARREAGGPSDAYGSIVNWGANGVSYPNTWVRLRRQGNTFRSYWSKDGQNWNLVTAETPATPYPETIWLGMATTAQRDETGFFAQTKYRNYGNTPVTPAAIATQPIGGTRYTGGNFTMTAAITGIDPIQIQWYKDGTAIEGANSATLALRDLKASDAGRYTVRATNAGGTATSNEAILEVLPRNVTSTEIPALDVIVFDAATKAVNNRGDQENVIDGNLLSSSYLTPGSAASPHVVALDLGAAKMINRLRIAKGADIDGAGALVDNMNLELWYTADSGPLNTRNYTRVTGLATGFLNEEMMVADSVNSDGTITKDHHEFNTDGWASLRFNPVEATGFAILFARDAGDDRNFTHYLVHELELYHDVSTGSGDVSLGIAKQGNQIVISWPSAASGYVLESSPALGSSANWSAVAGTPTEQGGSKSITVNASGNAAFFRLRQ